MRSLTNQSFMIGGDVLQLLERFDLAEHYPMILVCPVEELGEIDVLQIEAVDLVRIVDRPSDAHDDEHLVPGFVHGALVVGELVVRAPDYAAVRLGMGTVLDLHPELPSSRPIDETEVGIDHAVDVPPAGVVVGRGAMDQGEPVFREHPSDIVLELVTLAIHLALMSLGPAALGLDTLLLLTAQSFPALPLDPSLVGLDATVLCPIMEEFL